MRAIGDVAVRACTIGEAIETIEQARASRAPLRVAFLNAHLSNCAARQGEVSQALRRCLVLNDGVGLDLASRLLYGQAFPANLNGTDFVPLLLDGMRPGLRIFLLGGSEEVVGRAAFLFASRWPAHAIVGHHHGYFTASDEGALAAAIKAARADLILVGMGCPRQEMWMDRFIPEVCPIGLGVGALFDFETGRIRRAPAFIRRARCEWTYRLALEPRRLARRYVLGNAVFLARVVAQKIRGAPPVG